MLKSLRISKFEFIFLMAFLMAITALSIDAVLPALDFMAKDFDVSSSEIQLIITILFVGFVLGNIIFGPLSDRFGRLPIIYAGIILFIFGCLLTINAQSLELALLGRFIQGIGVSGPRIIVAALVRDIYSGRPMARIMSFVTTIFMIVPILAPMLGQALLWLGPWQVIFAMYIITAITLCLWVRLRLDETLLVDNRSSIQMKSLWHSFISILTNRISCGYTIVSGFIFGGFLGYLSSSQWLFQGIYQVGEVFPVYFGALVLPNLVSSLINAKLVIKWGMFRLVQVTNVLVFFGSMGLYLYAQSYNGIPPLMHLMGFLLIIFSGIGFQFGNLNSLAMEPLGRIAGIGASFIGAGSMLISIPIGGLIGMSLSTNIFPLAIGMALCSLLSMLTMHWVRFGFSLPKVGAGFKL
jgi:DHA1 family bicyclomycin/chloramphenicol resistance-like MFS transporter